MKLYLLSINKLINICNIYNIPYIYYNKNHLLFQIKNSKQFYLLSKKFKGGSKEITTDKWITNFNFFNIIEYYQLFFDFLIQYNYKYKNIFNNFNKKIMITIPHAIVDNREDKLGDQLSLIYGWIMYFLLKDLKKNNTVDIFIGNVHRRDFDLNRSAGNTDGFIKNKIKEYDIILDVHSAYDSVTDAYILLLKEEIDTIKLEYFNDERKKIGTNDNYIIKEAYEASKIGILLEFTGNKNYIDNDLEMMYQIIKYINSY